jgi:NAD(P)-dependent dehydrogenase (short-subunit alcohol dehydrogenase family)
MSAVSSKILAYALKFVVTGGLRERLLASSPARIVNSASAAHQGATLGGDLQSAKSFGAMKAYSRSKLCNILFTRELARRLHGTGVTAIAGIRLRRHALRRPKRRRDLALRWARQALRNFPRKGAETIIYLASSAAVAETTGVYFYKCPPIRPSHVALDDRAALLLWERSVDLGGLNA